MQPSHDQPPAHRQSIREEHVEQISLYGKARCRFEIRMMAGEVRKMDVRLLLGRRENSKDGGGGGGENADSKLQDDALLLAATASDKLLLPLGIREHRQSLITDEHLPTKPKIPLAQPERRLSVPLELLTKEWPQLTTQPEEAQPCRDVGNIVTPRTNTSTTTAKTPVSRPKSVYLPTTATRNDYYIDRSSRNISLDNDQPATSSLLLHHETSSSSSYSHTQSEASRLDSGLFFSPHIIPPAVPPPRLPDFEYGDLIRQVRAVSGTTARRGGGNNKKKKKEKKQGQGGGGGGQIIQQAIPNPFSPPRLHRVVRLTSREHDRVQTGLSRHSLFWLLIVAVPCPWLLLLFGSGMMDELADWLTEGDVCSFGKREKKLAVWLGFVIMALWIGVGVWSLDLEG